MVTNQAHSYDIVPGGDTKQQYSAVGFDLSFSRARGVYRAASEGVCVCPVAVTSASLFAKGIRSLLNHAVRLLHCSFRVAIWLRIGAF